ncbi:MAG: response regulator [Desulfobacterales bacterium]|jgi:two-component system chemotaxis response regulator CheY
MAINALIIDDSAVMRAMILKAMRMSGLPLGDIYQAADGRQGLKVLNEHWIDLVLLDISMPVMDGEQMLDYMIEDPDLKDIPVVVISTEGSQARIERLQRKGARFVHKPFSAEILRNTVKDILGVGADNE